MAGHCRLFARQPVELDRPLGDAAEIDAAAVVLDHDLQAIVIVGDAERHAALATACRSGAFLRRLDAVTDRITQDVHDRVLDPLQDEAVGLAIEPLDDHLDLLAFAAGKIADHLAE